jgi:tetratricopeptide (TPR) repeat protein
MKYLPPILILLLLSTAYSDDFSSKFVKLKKDENTALIQEFLEKASVSEANNPDYYAIAGNYWWQLACSINISTKPSDGADLSVTDQKSGKEVGSISTLGQTRPEIPKKALGILSAGATKFPFRADIVLGLASVQKQMGMTKEYLGTLKALLSEAKRNPKNLKWTANSPLRTAAEIFIPEAMQGYSADLYRAGPASAPLCIELCSAIIAAFPEHPYAYNILAAVASGQGKDEEALRLLKEANSKDPKDSLILLNLGDAYARVHQDAKAIGTYKKVLESSAEPEVISQAKDAINKVEGAAH